MPGGQRLVRGGQHLSVPTLGGLPLASPHSLAPYGQSPHLDARLHISPGRGASAPAAGACHACLSLSVSRRSRARGVVSAVLLMASPTRSASVKGPLSWPMAGSGPSEMRYSHPMCLWLDSTVPGLKPGPDWSGAVAEADPWQSFWPKS